MPISRRRANQLLTNRGGFGLYRKLTPVERQKADSLAPFGVTETVKSVETILANAPKDRITPGLESLIVPISSLKPDPQNARLHDERNLESIKLSLALYGQTTPVVVRKETGIVVAGNGRLEAAKQLGWTKLAANVVPMTDLEATGYALADNQTAELATWDIDIKSRLSRMLVESNVPVVGVTEDELVGMWLHQLGDEIVDDSQSTSLAERFGVPPFSVLDTRQGYWQDRKRAWLALGIQSEIGREAKSFQVHDWVAGVNGDVDNVSGGGTSIFDPVLCELVYRWFSPYGGRILDPFAGGSVRGVVACKLGRIYTGIDLSSEQVESNIRQATRICTESETIYVRRDSRISDPSLLTPVEMHGGYYVKRDDLYNAGTPEHSSLGGKARTCLHLASNSKGVTTAGSRSSPQVAIVSAVAKKLGIPCRVFVPTGPLTSELIEAANNGAELARIHPGHNTVICARAREYAQRKGWKYIPFGMECKEAVEMTSRQVANIPDEVKRIVVPVGSGMTLAGILKGLKTYGRDDVTIIGVVVGADPSKRLNQYAPGWRARVELAPAGMDYADRPVRTDLFGLQLDPIYEAKCLQFLGDGDCLWIVGIRQSFVPKVEEVNGEGTVTSLPNWIVGDSRNVHNLCTGEYDLIFTCPPYHDLEVYSTDPRDLSNGTYTQFLQSLKSIIIRSTSMLKNNRFAVMVVGDIRGEDHTLRNFPGHVIEMFKTAGLNLHNDAILLNISGSLKLRAGGQFLNSRKLGMSHQRVLVFCKGDPLVASRECGSPEFGERG